MFSLNNQFANVSFCLHPKSFFHSHLFRYFGIEQNFCVISRYTVVTGTGFQVAMRV